MNYKELIKCAKKAKIKKVQIYEKETNEVDIKIFNDTLEKYEIASNKKITIEGIYKNKRVSVILEKDKFSIDEIIELIKRNASIIETDNKDMILSNNEYEEVNQIDTYEVLDYEKIKNDLISYNKKYKGKFKDLKNITTNFNETINKIKIINTEGLCLEDINKHYFFGVEAVILKNNNIGTFESVEYNTIYDEINFDKIIEKTIKEAIQTTKYKNIESGKYKILLNNDCMTSILDIIVPIFYSTNLLDNKSPLADKLNKKVFSNKISIIEDPQNEKMPNKRLFDDEGVATIKKNIIENGIFKVALYSLDSASKDNTKSTGNGYNNDIGFTNLYIKSGKDNYEDLIKKMDTGIIINQLAGMHAGINIINGNISLQASGYKIENGKIKHSIKNITMSTNIFDLLSNIESICNDLVFTNLKCASPSILIKDIFISQ